MINYDYSANILEQRKMNGIVSTHKNINENRGQFTNYPNTNASVLGNQTKFLKSLASNQNASTKTINESSIDEYKWNKYYHNNMHQNNGQATNFGFSIVNTERNLQNIIDTSKYLPNSTSYKNSRDREPSLEEYNNDSQKTLVNDHSKNELYNYNTDPEKYIDYTKQQDKENAIDGSLSITIRPIGYMDVQFGKPEKLVGQGTGGKVNLHRCRVRNRLVAIKGFNKQAKNASGEKVARSCLAELAISVNVNHENVIRTLDVIMEYDHTYFCVMEYCQTDMFSLLQEREVEPTELHCYFGQLCEGIRYLHSKGIAHRDLKLDNICITANGTLKIVDFGCATIFKRKVPIVMQQVHGSSDQTLNDKQVYQNYLSNKGVESVHMVRSDNYMYGTNPPHPSHQSSASYENPKLSKIRADYNKSYGKGISSTDIKDGGFYSAENNDVPNTELLQNQINGYKGASQYPPSNYSRYYQKYAYVDLPSHGLCGSDPYIAPELYIYDSYEAKKVDVWAAGIIFLSMKNLHFPWDVANSLKDKNFATYTKMPSAFINIWLKGDPGPINLISKMLALQPSARITIDSVFSDPWFSTLSICSTECIKQNHTHKISIQEI
ncbi:hypothetical protein BB560_003307 [Smittium megazygosporum]|uniref:non-specific serine/threonine protein kinase n=1 Tax=Smittium megazygosporum TaxID=133381 RepID=A0A2T9ZCG2_9FUNG|nr:hypothetical protein BB560_003307 [Smittium megazygosporum]